jgi:hypothetical protein
MQKFSIFTVILASVLVVVVAEFAINGYNSGAIGDEGALTFNLPDSLDISQAITTDVLGADGSGAADATIDEFGFVDSPREETPIEESPDVVYDEIPFSSGLADFEDTNFVAPSIDSTYLRDDQVQSAGFSGAKIQKDDSGGPLFKTIYIEDLQDVKVEKWSVANDTTIFAKVYVLSFAGSSGIEEVYKVLKIRSSQGLNAEINETNDYADGSFYMNDSQRQNTAFVVTKIGPVIYAFSYPKEYHQQIKNLITLLDLEY